jgi:hypothetical protein
MNPIKKLEELRDKLKGSCSYGVKVKYGHTIAVNEYALKEVIEVLNKEILRQVELELNQGIKEN